MGVTETPPLADPISLLYRQSTQYQHWRFTPKELQELREQVHHASAVAVTTSHLLEERLAQGKSISLTDLEPQSNLVLKKDICTWQEQKSFCRYWEAKIMDYCKVFHLDVTVQDNVTTTQPTHQATAITFFKRFYLKNTIMEYDPRVFLMTSLFLACKVENCALSLSEYLKKVPNAPSSDKMMDLEFTLSTGLNFEYQVHHPYLPMHGSFLDLETYFHAHKEASQVPELLKKSLSCHAKATELITQSLLTDLCFLYSPAQIGLGCFWSASKEFGLQEEVDQYISHTWRGEKPAVVIALREVLARIEKQIISCKPTDAAEAKKVDTKLKQCRDLKRVPESLLAQFIATEEKKKEEMEKPESKKLKMESLSPF